MMDSIDAFVGIKENEEQLNINVFPNPVNDILHLELNLNSLVNIQLYNQLSELVFDMKTENSAIEINMSSFFDGMYLLLVRSNEGVGSKKIIVRH